MCCIYLYKFRGVAACCTGDLFILVYSVDSRESFDEVRRLLAEIYES